MSTLVQQNMTHLMEQRNSIEDAEDARRKYILRHRMKHLVPYFTSQEHENGPFKLVCDDLRPGNVIVDPKTLDLKAVIDWEWSYVAPYQFLYCPPTWLILQHPTSWISESETLYET